MGLMGKIFDAGILLQIAKERKEPAPGSVKLLTEDPIAISQLFTSAQYLYVSMKLAEIKSRPLHHSAENLVALIKKEYQLE
jgi:hypothetical protein